MRMRFLFISCAAVWLFSGCSAERNDPPPPDQTEDGGSCDGGSCSTPCDGGSCQTTMRAFGQSCSRNGDCESGVCLPVGEGRNTCTKSCTDTSGCLAGWSCGTLTGQTQQICLCTAGNESCDGQDNDCDGVIDNEPVADLQCTVEHSAAWACQSGACAKVGCDTDVDCDSAQACDLTSHRCGPIPGKIQICRVNSNSGLIDPTSCYPGAASPPSVSFGSVAVGEEKGLALRVFNTGGSNLTLTLQLDSSTPFGIAPGGVTQIAPGDSTDVGLTFIPTANGLASGMLTIGSSDPSNPSVDVPLSGTGVGPQLCTNPSQLDFGPVAAGLSRTLSLTISNCGQVDVEITRFELTNATSSTVFTVASGESSAIPSLPFSLPMGHSFTINVVYTPIAETTSDDAGSILLQAGNVQVTVPLSGQGASQSCTDNGENITPTASVRVSQHFHTVSNPGTATLDPNVAITLDGTASSAPSPSQITDYEWSLISKPSGSSVSLSSTSTVTPTFTPDLAGDYTIELVVSTNSSCLSQPVDVTLHVGAAPGIHIQLTWPETYGDVDLHYIGPGGAFNQSSPPSDLDWTYSQATAYGLGAPTPTGNPSPDWGLNNTCSADGDPTNDATFDLDQRQGYGPEDVTHRQPFDGTYKVLVHYYCNGSGTTASPALVIYVNGQVAWQGNMPGMTTRQVWEAAQIDVSNHGQTIVVTPLSTPLYTATQGC